MFSLKFSGLNFLSTLKENLSLILLAKSLSSLSMLAAATAVVIAFFFAAFLFFLVSAIPAANFILAFILAKSFLVCSACFSFCLSNFFFNLGRVFSSSSFSYSFNFFFSSSVKPCFSPNFLNALLYFSIPDLTLLL